MASKEDILARVTEILVELFEADADDVNMETRLYEDLDIDSIDAVDLVIELKSYTNKKIAPEDFKSVRTVGDVVNAVHSLMENG